MANIRKPTAPGGGKIPPPAPLANSHLTLSFKHFRHRPPFTFDEAKDKDGYPLALLQRLTAVCQMTAKELRNDRSKSLRSHAIDWSDTTEPNGFDHLNAQLREQIGEGWQFNVSANEHGRVHGFWIDDTFFVVWIDPGHKLYAGG